MKCQFLCFFITLDLVWPKFYPKDYTHFLFFVDFQWNKLRDSINFNNLCWNPVVLGKQIGKTSKNYSFSVKFVQKRRYYGSCPKWKKNFLLEITKAGHQVPETFYFLKISYVLVEVWIFFYLEWCFLSKKCSFQLKQLWMFLIRPFSFGYVVN